MATCGSGVWTGTGRIPARWVIRLARRRGRTACIAAAVGTSTPTAAGLQPAITTTRTTVTSILVSGLSCPQVSSELRQASAFFSGNPERGSPILLNTLPRVMEELMKRINVLLCFLVLLGAGCLTSQKVGLLDLDTGHSVTFSSETPYWDAIVTTPVDSQYVYHMYRKDEGLRLVKRDLTGKVLKEISMPLFYPWYTSAHVALRPDESGVAYLKYETADLFYFDFTSGKESLLASNIASSELTLKDLVWIDNRYLVATREQDTKIGRVMASVVKIDSEGRQIVAELALREKRPADVSISPSRRFLAISPDDWGQGICIVDLVSLKVVSEVPVTDKRSYMIRPAWLADSITLAYVDGNTLSVFSLTDNSIKPIMEIPKDHVCYFVGYPRKNLLLVRSGTSGGNSKLKMINPVSGQIVKTISKPFNGSMLLIADGKVLAHIIGY